MLLIFEVSSPSISLFIYLSIHPGCGFCRRPRALFPPPVVHVRLHPRRSTRWNQRLATQTLAAVRSACPAAAAQRQRGFEGGGGRSASPSSGADSVRFFRLKGDEFGSARRFRSARLRRDAAAVKNSILAELCGAAGWITSSRNGSRIPAGPACRSSEPCFFSGNVPDGHRDPGRDFAGSRSLSWSRRPRLEE